MRKIKCPSCGAENEVGSKTCDDCGRYLSGAGRSSEQTHDPMRGCCEVASMSGRCHYPGVFSASTVGGGVLKCRKHDQDNGFNTDEIIMESHKEIPNPDYSISAVRERIERLFIRGLMQSKYIHEVDKNKLTYGINNVVKRFKV